MLNEALAPHRDAIVALAERGGLRRTAALRGLFDDFAVRDLAAGTALAADFERFVREGGDALHEHALFEALQAERPGNWADWPVGWRQPGDAASVRYHLFLQWLTQRSFAAAQTAARTAGSRAVSAIAAETTFLPSSTISTRSPSVTVFLSILTPTVVRYLSENML